MTDITGGRKLMDHMIAFARSAFEETGQLMPMWHLVDAQGQSSIYMTPFNGDDEKTLTGTFIRAMVKKHNAIRIGFMSETWVASYPEGTSEKDAQKIMPSEHPERKEALYLTCEEIDGTNYSAFIDISRDADGKGILGKTDETTMNATTGRFTNFFERPKATTH